MSNLNERLLAHIKSNPALEGRLLGSGATLEQAQEYANTLLGCMASGIADADLPFPVTYSVSSPTVSGLDIEIIGNLSNSERPSWGSGGPAEIERLFNNGYDLKTTKLPFGPWGTTGRMGRAMPSRGGKRFVQQIAEDFKSKVPDSVDITYDPKYDR